MDVPRKITRNTLTNAAGFAVQFLTSMLLLPFIVRSIGNEAYGGIWAIVGTLTMSLGLLDLGTGTAFVKYISEFHARGDATSLSEVVNTGFAMYAAFGLVILPTTWFAGEYLLSVIGVPPALMSYAVFVLRIGMVVFVLAALLAPLTTVVFGIQRMDLNLIASVASQLTNIAGCITVITLGLGVRGLIVNNLLVLLVNSAILAWFALRIVPTIRFGPAYCTRSMAKRFLGYGMNLQVSKLAQVFLFQLDRIVTLRVFGTVSAAFYDIGGRLCNGGRSVVTLTISALIPAVSELHALDERERLLTLYRRGSKYVSIAATFVFLFVGTFSSDIVRTWMGEGYAASAMIVSALACGYFFNVTTGIASAVAAGVGRTDFERRGGVLSALLNVVTISVGALLFGAVGIAAGTSISLVGGAFYLFHQVDRLLEHPRQTRWVSLAKPLFVGIAAAGSAFMFRLFLLPDTVSRASGILVLVVSLSIFTVVFAVLLWVFHILDRSDLSILRILPVRRRFLDPSEHREH